MLNITVKPGEYFIIGDDIKVIFVGGTANNARVMIDAPKSYNIVRGKALERNDGEKPADSYYVEAPIPEKKLKRMIAAQQASKSQ